MNKRFLKGFTLAEESCHFGHFVPKIGRDWNSLKQSKGKTFAKLKAFTLAEVLITLAIIGIVASLTIPTLVTNYKKKTYVTQLKKTYNYLTNGFHQIMANDGVSNLSDTKLWNMIPTITDVIPAQTYQMGETTITFPESTIDRTFVATSDLLKNEVANFKNELIKTFNISAIYNENTMPDDYKVSYKNLDGTDAGKRITSGIYLNDGTYLDINFNKASSTFSCGSTPCTSLKEFQEYRQSPTKFWQWLGGVNIDINGPKGPNVYGRDYFQFMLGNDGTLYPSSGLDIMLIQMGCSVEDAINCPAYWKYNDNEACNSNGQSTGSGCAARIMEEGWEMNY